MMKAWYGMGLLVTVFTALTIGLRAYRRRRSPNAELVRKALHVGMGLVTLTFPWLFSSTWPVMLLSLVFTLGLTLTRFFLTLRSLLVEVIDAVERKSIGDIVFPMAVGLLFRLSAGEPLTFCIPILILTFADPAAALIGARYGTLRYSIYEGEKSLEGSLAFLAIAFFCTLVPLLLLTGTGRVESLLIALILAFLLTLLEAIAWRGLDNLFIPLGAFLLLKSFLTLDLAALVTRLGIALVLVTLFVVCCPGRVPFRRINSTTRVGSFENFHQELRRFER